MTFWTLPTAIEGAIFALCLIIARTALHLRLRSAAAALIMMCPVPLAYLVAGGDSAVFPSDVLAVCCLLWLAISRRVRGVFADNTARLPVVLATLVLVLVPSVSTALGLIETSQGDWKLIAIGLCRGLAYLGLFCAAIGFASRGEELDKLITLQCIAFSLICCCGILQNITGLDLSLPDPNLVHGLTIDSAAGFMGLYRGAVGAWGAPMLGAIPLVLLRRRYGWVLAPACMLVVLTAIILVGSRQGLVIGLIAAVVGTISSLATARRSIWSVVRSLLAVLALGLGGLYLLSTTTNTTYDTWMSQRFGKILDSTSLFEQVASRDNRMWFALDRWIHAPLMVQALGAGRGRLALDVTDDPRMVVYVDSELVWQIQETGLVNMVIYLSFLILLARRFRSLQRATGATRTTILVAKVALIAGVCLTYGHFFLLHVLAPQAPVAYWNWALFGAALGVGIRAKREGRRSPVTASRPNRSVIVQRNAIPTK